MIIQMKQRAAFFMFPLLLSLVLVSCCKDSDIPDPYAPSPIDTLANCVEGLNGNIEVKLTAVHHNDTIPSQVNYPDSAFIKFNAIEFPGDDPALYDLVIAGSFPDTAIFVDSLSCGYYFIFMTGWDVSIAQRVKGGIPVAFSESDVLRNIKVPVTED